MPIDTADDEARRAQAFVWAMSILEQTTDITISNFISTAAEIEHYLKEGVNRALPN